MSFCALGAPEPAEASPGAGEYVFSQNTQTQTRAAGMEYGDIGSTEQSEMAQGLEQVHGAAAGSPA